MIFERGHFNENRVDESFIYESLKNMQRFNLNYEFSYNVTVFLSHKHDDLNEIRGVIGLLKKSGATIYIDSMDNKMPHQTSGETALRIKDVINFCDKFIFLATNNAIESYWCNWELGIGDRTKYIDRIAILPIKEKGSYDSNYKGNEYLQIYPSIDYESGTNHYLDTKEIILPGYYFCKPRNKEGIRYITPLNKWLNQKY